MKPAPPPAESYQSITMKSKLTATIAVLAAMAGPPALAGGSKEPVKTGNGDWQWSLSGGPFMHSMGRLNVTGGSRSQSLALPSFVGDASLFVPPIGDDLVFGDRFYNDGFVRQDASTATDGSTWFWGYDNAGQVVDGSLVFQATGFESIRTDRIDTTAGRRADERMSGGGVSLRADVTTPWSWGPFRIGGMLGLGVASDSRSYQFANHSTTQIRDDYRLDYTDRYDLGGVIPPGAPYVGDIGGPGPLIGNLPSVRGLAPVLLLTDTAVFANDVSARFRNEMIGFSFGGSLEYQHHPWSFILSSGLILELHRYKATQRERLNLTTGGGSAGFADWSDKNSGTKVRPGLFMEAVARYGLDGGVFIDGFLRGEIADDFSVGAGPSTFQFDPVGYSIGVRVGRSF